MIKRDIQYFQFCTYGFLKNLRFFEPFLILILHSEGLSFTQIASLYAIREISRNILEIPAGIFADAFGRRKSMIIAFFSYLISFLVFYMSTTFSLFIVAFFLYSIGDAFRTGTHKAMIFTYLKLKSIENQKVNYYGHTRSWSQIGSAVSALGAGLIVLISGNYKIIFLITTIPYIMDLINLATYPKALEGEIKKTRERSLFLIIKTTINDFLKSFRNPEVRKTIFSISSYTGYYKTVKDFIQPIIQGFALTIPILALKSEGDRTAILIGGIYFLIFLISSFAARYSDVFVKKFSKPVYALSSSIILGSLMGVISGIFINLDLFLMAIIFFTFIYLFQNLRKPIGIGRIADNIKPEIMASALSFESQAETLFTTVFVLILGFMIDSLGLGWGIISISLTVFLINIIAMTGRKTKK